jgi:hypothetical protein
MKTEKRNFKKKCVGLNGLSLHYVTCFLALSVTENNKRQNFKV